MCMHMRFCVYDGLAPDLHVTSLVLELFRTRIGTDQTARMYRFVFRMRKVRVSRDEVQI